MRLRKGDGALRLIVRYLSYTTVIILLELVVADSSVDITEPVCSCHWKLRVKYV